MKIILLRFSSRARYGRALRHLWNHPERYNVILRGADYSACAILRDKARGCGWYIEFEITEEV